MTEIQVVDAVRHDTAVTAIASSSWSELTSAVLGPVRSIDVFDSTGQGLLLARGKSGSEEQIKLIIPPGGIDRTPVMFGKYERISIKAYTSATAGLVIVNFYR